MNSYETRSVDESFQGRLKHRQDALLLDEQFNDTFPVICRLSRYPENSIQFSVWKKYSVIFLTSHFRFLFGMRSEEGFLEKSLRVVETVSTLDWNVLTDFGKDGIESFLEEIREACCLALDNPDWIWGTKIQI